MKQVAKIDPDGSTSSYAEGSRAKLILDGRPSILDPPSWLGDLGVIGLGKQPHGARVPSLESSACFGCAPPLGTHSALDLEILGIADRWPDSGCAALRRKLTYTNRASARYHEDRWPR